MTVVARGLWYIESHYREPMKLEDAATAAGVSRYHFARAFSLAVGMAPRTYLRRRRMAAAVEQLLAGTDDLLALALAIGYGSHEAFSRAFRQEIGATPEAVRAHGLPDTATVLQPVLLEERSMKESLEVTIEERAAWYVVGVERPHQRMPSPDISDQWQSFGPHIGRIPNQVGMLSYGLMMAPEDDTENRYLCGVEVSSLDQVPDNMVGYAVPAGRYAVAQHRGHVAEVGQSFRALFEDWLPGSPWEPLPGPCFELYDDRFDPMTGQGGFSLWTPVQERATS
jgi:AraC family transcriptional regulator